MGTDQLGFFELFDPKHHLTGVERSDLDRKGLTVDSSEVHHLLDFTLVYKNSRIWIEDERHFHVSFCSAFTRRDKYRIGTSKRALKAGRSICPKCLQKLQYKGYDDLKARKEAYSRSVLEAFTLDQFWRGHILYPVSEKRDLRKNLESA